MKRFSLTKCPLCGDEQLEPVLTCVDSYASGEMFKLCRCARCGFLMTQDAPAEEEIARYYEAPDYISHTDTRKGVMNRVYHWARSYMLRRKAQLVERESHATKERLLDIGTGTGYFAAEMARRGWQVDAVEKSAQARKFAKEHFGLKVLPDHSLDSLPEGAYRVVTLWHVMEHLYDLEATWKRIHQLLEERGVLIVAVPNCTSWDARKYGAYWAAYDVPRHLWHFTPNTIQQMGEKQGFILAERFPMPLDAFYVSMLSEKHMHHKAAFLRGLLAGIPAWWASLVRKERSSSMIYVFRKKRGGLQ